MVGTIGVEDGWGFRVGIGLVFEISHCWTIPLWNEEFVGLHPKGYSIIKLIQLDVYLSIYTYLSIFL